MEIYRCRQWVSDLNEAIDSLSELEELEDKTILITGATGLICSAVADILIRYNETHSKMINIIVAGRSYQKTEKRFGEHLKRNYMHFLNFDGTNMCNELNLKSDYIIHGASNAYPDAIMKEPVETILSNIVGTKQLLDSMKKNGTSRIILISSSEVYGQKEDNLPYREDEYGYVDLLNERNSYSVAKRAAETLCISYAKEYGIEAVIARPGHIYGPTAAPGDNRVASAWAYQAARGENIVMKSDGVQLRSYCYCLDCASAILKILLRGENKCAYNISNPDSVISIRELADFYASYAGVNVMMNRPTKEERNGFNPMQNSSLDASNLYILGWKGNFNAKRGTSHTISILKEIM